MFNKQLEFRRGSASGSSLGTPRHSHEDCRCGDEEFRIPREGEAFGCNYGGGGRICPDATPVCLNHEKVAEGYKLRPETWPGFDNFFQSFITVFISTTLEGWQDIMYRCGL